MENQRVRLSKSLLKNALISLLEEKAIEKVTVYEICTVSQINRTTFYKYYGSQYDLLNDIEGDLFSELEELLGIGDPDDVNNLSTVLDYLRQERKKCKVLINSVPDTSFSEKLFSLKTIQSILITRTPKQYNEWQSEYLHLFFCQGYYAIIRKWINSDCREPVQSIAALVASLGSLLIKS
ncbi:MAG TPA: TetR-like C-terminal domain-containing protein [Bacillota bacterium]|nr:TetR-like C-terminal domain-containing protein [Bacillota bacterium]